MKSRWPALLGVLVVGAYFGHLLLPGRVLMVRDLPFLHLPLRETFVALATADGFTWPGWNPTIHGGQPVLSNPHYQAWYPATWLGFLIPVRTAIHLTVLAHAALAFAGAWRLLRQLGASPWGRAFAAVAFAGGGYYVALTNTLLVFTGMAWTPWVLAGADAWLRRPGFRSLLAVAAPLGLQILNGDPASVAVSAVFCLLLATSAAREASVARSGGRLLLAALLALGLAAVQFVPTWARLLDSSRGTGLSFTDATVWSTRPARLVEAVFPTFHGEAARDEENLYFGWTLHDRQFPLLISIYPGLLTVCLGIAGFAARGLARRGVWIGAALVGLFLGLGRHNPLFAAAHELVPFLGMVRYPEKFLLLTLTALVVSAALLFDRMVTTPQPAARWAIGCAVAASAAAAGRAVWTQLAPEAVADWLRRACGFALSPAVQVQALHYLRLQGALALAVATTAVLVLIGLRVVRPARAAILALVFLAADNWAYSHRFNPTLPREEFSQPPLVAALPAPPRNERIFHDVAFYRGKAMGLQVGRRGFHQILVRLARLEPYSAALWGQSYALHEDYDLMLTAWGRHALRLLHEEYEQVDRRDHLLGAWNVGSLLRVRSPAEMQPDLEAWRRLPDRDRSSQAPAAVRLERNAAVQPRVRLARRAEAHPDIERAVEAARAERLDSTRGEHLVMPDGPAGPLPTRAGTIVAADARTDARNIRFQVSDESAGGVATVIVAETFDSGWTARDEAGNQLATFPTALGQIAIRVPAPRAGTADLRLAYHDAWVRVGGAISAVTLLGLLLAFLRRRGRMIDAAP